MTSHDDERREREKRELLSKLAAMFASVDPTQFNTREASDEAFAVLVKWFHNAEQLCRAQGQHGAADKLVRQREAFELTRELPNELFDLLRGESPPSGS